MLLVEIVGWFFASSSGGASFFDPKKFLAEGGYTTPYNSDYNAVQLQQKIFIGQ